MLGKCVTASLKFYLLILLLTGAVYPLFITGIAGVLFPQKSRGSLIRENYRVIGSLLIGQKFDSAIYFSGRPSFVSYNPLPSGASNYALTGKKLQDQYRRNKNRFVEVNKTGIRSEVPAEMVFASASGLDPHISPEAASLQVDRVAAARGFDQLQKQELRILISSLTEPPQLLFLGKEKTNVLLLNLKTDLIK